MDLPKELFWDVQYPRSAEEWDAHYFFVIERVLQRGTIQDWLRVKDYYGDERLQEVFRHSRSLHPRAMAFGVALYGEGARNRACSPVPFHQKSWPY